MNRPLLARALGAALTLFVSGCTGIEPELRTLMEQTNPQAGTQDWHVGPPVEIADSGTARFAKTLYEGFRPQRALEHVKIIDRWYRAPANEGYDEVLAKLDESLREIGFDGPDERLQVEFIPGPEIDAWTPIAGKLVLSVEGEAPKTLHSFSKPEEVDRVMLPVNVPSCSLRAEVALRLGDVKQGMVLVTDVDAGQVFTRAKNRGAAAIVSASLGQYNIDPSGKNRHLEAIQFITLEPGGGLPVFQISARTKEAIEEAVERAKERGKRVSLELESKVRVEKRPLRTLMALVRGASRPDEAVVLVSHVQEPGACDNASGVAGLLEGTRGLVEAMRENKIPWPERTLVFLWGDEFRQTERWLATTDMKPVIGISSDMTGQSKETGAKALLERNYDPGALKVLAPDEHTLWGAGQVDPSQIVPNGLAVIARCAMADVSLIEGGTWQTGEHPWEGGSDHDIFIRRGIPAVLFWHFTDFAYHTSLDRMQFVDGEEMRRTGVALLATALAVASPLPADLDRYIRSNERDFQIRSRAAEAAQEIELFERWEKWRDGTREWLINLCRGSEEKLPVPK